VAAVGNIRVPNSEGPVTSEGAKGMLKRSADPSGPVPTAAGMVPLWDRARGLNDAGNGGVLRSGSVPGGISTVPLDVTATPLLFSVIRTIKSANEVWQNTEKSVAAATE